MASYVDAVEINSSFYRTPDARTAATWVRRTEDRPQFFFTAKLHQDITHGGKVEPAMVDAIHKGFEPIVKAGKLRHLLAQFRYDYRDLLTTRDHLKRIRDAFGGMTNMTFELRHNSWQAPEALEFLGGLHVTVANLDYPTAKDSFNLRVCAVGEHAYFRLHGRNYKAWFNKEAGRDETYNHLYNQQELKEIQVRATRISALSKSLTIIANNHYQGKELVSILQLKSMMTGKPVPAPPLLTKKYAELSSGFAVAVKDQEAGRVAAVPSLNQP